MELKTIDWVQRAYKKRKHSVYFDKTQLPLVDEIVEQETASEKGKGILFSGRIDARIVILNSH